MGERCLSHKLIIILILITVLILVRETLLAETIPITAVGEYVLGDNDTYIEGKRLALQDAKRIALEKVGTYLESTTEVRNGAVSVDEIRMYTAGIVKIEEIKEERSILENKATIIKVNVKASIDPNVLLKRIVSLRDRKEIETKAKNLNSENIKLRKEIDQLNQQLRNVVDENRYRSLKSQREGALTKILENEKGLTILIDGKSLFQSALYDKQKKQDDKSTIRRFFKEYAAAHQTSMRPPKVEDNGDGTANVTIGCDIYPPITWPEDSTREGNIIVNVESFRDILEIGFYFRRTYSSPACYDSKSICYVSGCYSKTNPQHCKIMEDYLNNEAKKLKLIGKLGQFRGKDIDYWRSSFPHSSKYYHDLIFYKIPLAELKKISQVELKMSYAADDESTDRPSTKTKKKEKR